jgi:ribosomal protein S12 methylthiotransferase accessory factor
MTLAEAKMGAYMEAIEFSFAEPGRNCLEWSTLKPEEIVNHYNNRIEFPDFCARLNVVVKQDDLVAVVMASEIMNCGGLLPVPAELVFQPFHNDKLKSIYGTTSNGLASGNSLAEATAHALAEVMERHVESFDLVRDRSISVAVADAPTPILHLIEKIENAGLSIALRYSPNDFGMAYFSAHILEADEHSSIAVANGSGFHPLREVAAARAILEAVQSRLTHIHGGRDDVIDRVALIEDIGRDAELNGIRLLRAAVQHRDGEIAYEEIPDIRVDTLDDCLSAMFSSLKKAGFSDVLRVVFNEPEYPFQIVRVIVPGAEMYEHVLQRVGPRLMEFSKDG